MTQNHPSLWRLVLFAGLAGGVAEVAWIAGYGVIAPLDAAEVARQVGVTLFPGARGWPGLPLLGIAAHLVLSLLLAAGYVLAVWRPLALRVGAAGVFTGAVVLGLGVWAVNFLVVLPRLNPEFVALLPAAVTLISKTLFGVAMAAAVHRQSATTSGMSFRPGRRPAGRSIRRLA